MMTTASKQVTTPVRGSGGVLAASAAVAAGVGAIVAIIAGVLDGGRAAVVGALTVVVVMFVGAASVDVVARRLPELVMAYALMTYSGQVVLLLLGSVLLRRSDLLDGAADRQWLGIAALVAVLVWLPAQIVLFTRQRIPVYDLPERAAGTSDDRSSDPIQAGEH